MPAPMIPYNPTHNEEATSWATTHDVNGDVVGISELAETAGAIWSSVVNSSEPKAADD